MEYITKGKLVLGLIIRNKVYSKKRGINFFTNNNFSQQVGFINRPKNYKINAHSHKNIKRIIKGTSEVILVLSGKMKIYFYDTKENYLFSKIVTKNDVIILINGGHGFKMLKNCKFIEVKQGPYVVEKDKVKFNS